MADRADITPELCRQLLEYDAGTGEFRWRPRPLSSFAHMKHPAMQHGRWCSRFSGRPALVTLSHGYKTGGIMGRQFFAHRVAFAIARDRWPKLIDHINGDKLDNRLCNLREADAVINGRNIRRRIDNVTGVTGVYPMRSRWQAQIKVRGKTYHLGCFGTLEEAAEVRRNAERSLGFTDRHGR